MKSKLKDTLLLVGDNSSDRPRLHDIFESDFYILEAETAEQGIMLLQQNSSSIAAVLADIPLGDGKDLQSLVDTCSSDTGIEIPVLAFIVPARTGELEEYAFVLGAADVVLKPYTTLSVRRRVQILVDLYANRWYLEKLVEDQSRTIRNANQTILDTLSAIIEHRSTESGNHVLRIRRLTYLLLQEVARSCPEYSLDEAAIDAIASASVLHDIGKISIPDAILNKPGPLTPQEIGVMRTHTTVGSLLVEQLESLGDIMYLRYAYNICLYHHERWDGSGYPKGLSKDDIPICAQVVGLTDAFDALTTSRVYKPAYEYDIAVNMILNGECGTFSPKLLECFKRVRQEIIALATQYADGYSPKSDQIRVPLPDPVHKPQALTSNQLSQLKYQALLHHMNDTVMELDVDNSVYHVIHNPNPDFVSLLSNATFDELGNRLMSEGVHPDDILTVSHLQQMLSQKLFRENQRKFSFCCRIYNAPHNEYYPYEITLLRVNTDIPSQRILLAIFHNLEKKRYFPPAKLKKLLDAPVLYDLMPAILCCKPDDAMTVLEGSNTLLHLTGYGEKEFKTEFGNSLHALIHPEDRNILPTLLKQPETFGHKLSCEYRIYHRSGRILWVLDRCRIHSDESGRQYCYHTLTDITASKQEHARLNSIIHRNHIIVNQTSGIIFEWDLQTDTTTFSEKWLERFGYPQEAANFSRLLRSGSHLHPDDAVQLREKAALLLQSSTTESAEIRIVSHAGRYVWSSIRATSVFDENGKPTHIIGIIHDIDRLKSDAITMKQQAQRDSLTKLLNKISAQEVISAYLAEISKNALAALLIMDLDNFKSVNDTHGHLYGDAVLTQIGTTLRSLFRSQDVIARIGGDEFLIFLKDIPNSAMVNTRCELLVNTFRTLLQKLMPDLNVSVSVGGALLPFHGLIYTDLFRHADEALYSAKRKGKNRYAIYDPQERYESLMDQASRITRIDSDLQPTMNDDSLIRFVFRCLYESRNIDATIDELLCFLGTHFNVSRVYIFENNEDNTCCSNTFEWCNEGIPPEKENLQNVSYITDIPGWPDVYDERGVFYCTDVTELEPHVRKIVEPQGIQSMLHCAIMDNGVFRGYVGFDECTKNYFWTQNQVSLLEFLAQVLAIFLLKARRSALPSP